MKKAKNKSAMRITATYFCLAKTGNRDEEYEDAYYPLDMGEFAGDQLRFAVADGASEGMLSWKWAALLARHFCRSTQNTFESFDSFVQEGQMEWQGWLQGYLQRRAEQNRPIQWFEEPGLEKGAFSTLLGIELAAAGNWKALACGDSCLFHIRHDRLLASFPLETPDSFTSRPYLIASNPTYNHHIAERAFTREGTWQTGDVLLLMTDALAHWFIENVVAGEKPWACLEAPERPEFGEWLHEVKSARKIRNDDVTLVRLVMH